MGLHPSTDPVWSDSFEIRCGICDLRESLSWLVHSQALRLQALVGMQAHLRVSWSPPSRNRHRGRSKDDTDIVAVTPEKKANLRRSAIAANATEAQEISTLHNADLDTIICAVARVVYQYTVRNDSVRIGKSEVRQPLVCTLGAGTVRFVMARTN